MSLIRFVFAALICVPLAVLTFRLGTADIAAKSGDQAAALSRSVTADSAARVAEALLAKGDAAQARALAETAVAREPLSQPAIRVLGFAHQTQGDAAGATALLARAASLGWRDAPTQAWLLDAALRDGAWDVAAQRLDALARRGDDEAARLFPLIRRLAADPAAGPAVTARIALNPPWRQNLFYSVAKLTPQEFADQDGLIDRLANTAMPMTRDEARTYISRLLILGRIDHARAVWLAAADVARNAGRGIVYDPGFAHVEPGTHILFEWAFPNTGGASAVVQPDDHDNPQLLASASGSEAATLAMQLLILPPGVHILTADRWNDDADAGERFHWRLACMPQQTFVPSALVESAPTGSGGRETTRFIVPAQGCEYQLLMLRADTGGLPGPSQARFDNVQIDG